MGNNASRSNNNEAPSPTVASDVFNNPDPRSPTPEVYRTPLQVKSTGKHNITKNVDLRKTFENADGEENLIHNNPILSAVIKNHLQSYDPRSPTQDFERTPIIISSKTDEIADRRLLRLQSDNFGSPVLRTENDDSYDSCTEVCEKSPDLVVSQLSERFSKLSLDTLNDTLNETAKPLGSSTASCEALENIIPSEELPKPFLETNFDYVDNEDKFVDSVENINSIEDIDITNGDENDGHEFKILDEDPRSPSIGIERTPIVVAKTEEDSNVETMSDDTLIKVLQNTNSELRQTGAKTDKNVNGLLIYEDEMANFNETPKKSKSANNEDKFVDSVENINSIEDIDITNGDENDGHEFKILDEDPRSPSIGIERTPIVVAKTEEDSNVETMSDDTLIKVLQNTNSELRQTGAKTDKNVNGLLIYEDEMANFNETPKKSKSASNSNSRTPLACMRNKADAGHIRSKSTNTLYDPKNLKIDSKIPKRVSHIPRLKALHKANSSAESSISLKSISKAASIGGDCENTPPHSHRDRWDKDNSIVL
ncbi:hypothetical protein PYW07_007113 [Mythimna separata]|uniref:Uncharacterized protein n=1 Tax=Mythimna separata TaxID=271217 RepID=A0AAD8E0V6_MYTSE|nr:hypothetical protein PYW07_007113 [Mythimna separata]